MSGSPGPFPPAYGSHFAKSSTIRSCRIVPNWGNSSQTYVLSIRSLNAVEDSTFSPRDDLLLANDLANSLKSGGPIELPGDVTEPEADVLRSVASGLEDPSRITFIKEPPKRPRIGKDHWRVLGFHRRSCGTIRLAGCGGFAGNGHYGSYGTSL